VGDVDRITQVTARRRAQLATAVDSGSDVLAVSARRRQELTAVMRQLPGFLRTTRTTVSAVTALADPLTRALVRARPAMRSLTPKLAAVRDLIPDVRSLLRRTESISSKAHNQLPTVRRFTGELHDAATRAAPDVAAASRVADVLSDHAGGVQQLSDLWSGVLSTNNVNGVMARAIASAVELPKPENLGLPIDTPLPEVYALLSKVLDKQCASAPLACIIRIGTPGMPPLSRLDDAEAAK
jgi:phospholipid/cholesterol/gamma-HCH transport system substrate-binding protein